MVRTLPNTLLAPNWGQHEAKPDSLLRPGEGRTHSRCSLPTRDDICLVQIPSTVRSGRATGGQSASWLPIPCPQM